MFHRALVIVHSHHWQLNNRAAVEAGSRNYCEDALECLLLEFLKVLGLRVVMMLAMLSSHRSLVMCPAREGGWGQGSHHSPAEALARPAGQALCHEGPLTETCQHCFSYLKNYKVKLMMTTVRLARITSEPVRGKIIRHFSSLVRAYNTGWSCT